MASEILRVVILCECNIYRRVCSLFSLAKCKVHHAFFTECATYISILEMGCNLNDVILFTRMRRSFLFYHYQTKIQMATFWPLQITPEFFKKYKWKCENSPLQVITFPIRNVVEARIWIKDEYNFPFTGNLFLVKPLMDKKSHFFFWFYSFNSSITNYEKQCT